MLLPPQPPKTYKSPIRKLAHFFEKSRDQWKAKARAAKARVKQLKQRVHFLESSRDHWKQRVAELAATLAEVTLVRDALRQELDQRTALSPVFASGRDLQPFERVPARQQYTVGLIHLFLAFVLAAATSLRGASAALEVVLAAFQLSWTCPSWSTGRLWLLRVGYYKLTRPKPRAKDWIWILDHTLQLGPVKCLLILGIRRQALPPPGVCLRYEDMEPLALWPVTHSNGAVVAHQLEATAAITGVPCEILGDQGPDLKAGEELFRIAHPTTRLIGDIKHQTAVLLKHELEHDPTWLAFLAQAAQTRLQVQQTDSAPLLPPSLRSKARYMNVDVLVTWGQQMLRLLAQPARLQTQGLDPAAVQAKVGWLQDFREPLQEWDEMLAVVTTTASYIRQAGLARGAAAEVTTRLRGLARTPRARRVRKALLTFVAQEEAKVKPHERLAGSSEVIESVLGKLKAVEQDQAKSGFTGLVLSVCALVSTTTAEVIQQALEAVPTKEVLEWCRKQLGASVQAKRKALFSSG